MCGFGGILNNSFSIYPKQLAEISSKVSFRGPDSCGIRIYDHNLQPAGEGNNAIFFNRLAIIDLDARSDQPFEDDRYSILFNGEIYNYLELKKSLEKEGCFFHTTSDTEVLFYALKQWGINGISRLNGMFAFCWIDRKNKSFLLARDRIGIKPLYYRQSGKSFIFSSELDSVLRLSDTLPFIQPKSVHAFLWTQFIPAPNTILQGVFKLPAGHYIEGTWDMLERQQSLSTKSYWDAYQQISINNASSDPVDLENVLVDSLSRQLIADVPLGLFLSSGVDSSLLAALVNKHFTGGQQFNFFTVAFDEATSSDESKDALEFIRGFNNPALLSHTLTVDAGSIGERLDNLYDYFDEPFGDQTSLLNWAISSKAKELVTVVLSGDGADELFWGYNRYDQWKNPSFNLFNRINIPGNIANLLKPFLPDTYWRTKLALELEPDPIHRHFTLFLPPALGHLLNEPIWDENIWALQHSALIRDRGDLAAILDIKTYLADAMLHKVDRASMAASLEVRVPYLDNVVIDYAFKLPFQYKSNEDFKHKAILKQLLQRLAPHYEINRPKKGFTFPLDKWLRLAWRDRVLSLINKDSLARLGLDYKIYLPIIDKYYKGNKQLTIVVWYLLNLVLWEKKFKNISLLQPI